MNVNNRRIKSSEYSYNQRRFLHRAFRTNASSLNVKSETSVYYWWWAYLKKNDQYSRCCELGGRGKLSRLYNDFGDIYNVDFQKWWLTNACGEYLFAEPLSPVQLHELNTVDEWHGDWTQDRVMIVSVPLSEPKRLLKSWFDELLKQRHTGRPGIPTKPNSEALYPVHTRFSVHALELMMLVYELRQAEPDLTLAEVGRKLKINPSAIPKRGDTKKEIADKKNSMSATVSRYLRKATAIIKNTSDGKFPCTD